MLDQDLAELYEVGTKQLKSKDEGTRMERIQRLPAGRQGSSRISVQPSFETAPTDDPDP